MPSTRRARRTRCAIAAASVACAVLPAAASALPANGPIVFESSSTIVSMPSTGGAKTALTPAGGHYHPAVSPDGTRIAFALNGNIWTMRRDGTDKRKVTTDGAGNDDPTWSPDGATIAYTSHAAGRTEIFMVPAAGGTPTNLTRTPANGEYNPAWSPAGNRIAYERAGCATPYGGGVCVYAMNADGSAQTNLTPENSVPGCESQPGYYFNGASREPAWSPDGQRIAFAGPLLCGIATSGTDIWTMAADGGGKTNLTRDNGTNDRMPEFSPDGTRIAFVRPGYGLFTMATAPAGGARQQISSGAFDLHPDWAAA